jgi:hypothetical protein
MREEGDKQISYSNSYCGKARQVTKKRPRSDSLTYCYNIHIEIRAWMKTVHITTVHGAFVSLVCRLPHRWELCAVDATD